MDYNYILFEQSAVEFLASRREYQNTEHDEGIAFVDLIRRPRRDVSHLGSRLRIKWTEDGVVFIGPKPTKTILTVDLTTCDLLKFEGDSPSDLLVVLQRMFRAAIRIWNHQPFTNVERVNHSKLVVFPFSYNLNGRDNKRLVIEREPNTPHLLDQGVSYPLLAYKYNDDIVAPGSEETPDTTVLNRAGEEYICLLSSLSGSGQDVHSTAALPQQQLEDYYTTTPVDSKSFRYKTFQEQYDSLTKKQQEVVNSPSCNHPIRIVGPAGTGKTTSMVLRAYRLLTRAEEEGKTKSILFITHSESARYEAEAAFRLLDHAEKFLRPSAEQTIEFITLLSYCKRYRGITDVQTVDEDAADAKEYQLMLIQDAYDAIQKTSYKSCKEFLSGPLRAVLDGTPGAVLVSLLQHEFSIQIKGRADGLREKYQELSSIPNGLPVSPDKAFWDKKYIYSIFMEYEKQLKSMSAYDTDDIAIESLMSLNAPIWRRERADYGYDDIFVDEIHLFNLNEQHIFHFLTKAREQTPICFALDYSQAIGDRGDLSGSYLETELSADATEFNYDYVFRSSEYIVSFCKSLIASGVQLFNTGFRNPYRKRGGDSPLIGDDPGQVPKLIMAENEEKMLQALRTQIDGILKTLQCKNHQIAIVSFDDKYLTKESIARLKDIIRRPLYYLEGRNIGQLKDAQANNAVLITSPYNVNGLEFSAVILLGVDGARVPPSQGVNDVSKNYLIHKAYNMLYLTVSRAKNAVILLGDKQNGDSECLDHSLSVHTLERSD